MGTLQNKRIVDPVLTEISRGYTNASLIGQISFQLLL